LPAARPAIFVVQQTRDHERGAEPRGGDERTEE
jgi:hypothetical protein